MFSPFLSFKNMILNLMLLNRFCCDWTSWNHGILTEWYPCSALVEVALEMCEQCGLTVLLGGLVWVLLVFFHFYIEKKVPVLDICSSYPLIICKNDCSSWVNVLLVCSELFQSMEFYVFIGRSWDLFVLLSMSRKVLENKEKRCPCGGGGSTGLECDAFRAQFPYAPGGTGLHHWVILLCPVW